MEKKDLEFEPIKTYRLPLGDIIARHYNTFKYLTYAVVLATIVLPILGVHNFHWHWVLYLSPLEILFIWTIIRGLLFLRENHKHAQWREEQKENPDHFTINEGAPGTGKSIEANFKTYYMAEGSWEDLQEEYFCLMARASKKDYELTEDDREIYEAYRYYMEHDGIPCLGTNIGVWSKRYRRWSYELGPAYLKQERRAPYRLVGWYDEVGTVFNHELSNDKTDAQKGLTIADTGRFCRHFAELRFVGTEQNGENTFKGLRNVVARVREMVKLEKVFKPLFLIWLYKRMMRHFINPLFGKGMRLRKAKKWGRLLKWLKGFTRKVGFLKISYKDYGRNGDCVSGEKRTGVIYLPCCAEFEYDTRAFRNGYLAKDKPIIMRVHNSKCMTAEKAHAFMRSSYRKEEEQKKSA